MPTTFPAPEPFSSKPRRVAHWRATAIALAVVGALALQGCARQDDAALGRELAAKGDHAGAAIALRSAVQAAPESAELRVLLADALERKHDLPGAEQQLRHAIEHGGDANVLVPRLALLMLDRGDVDALIRAYKDHRLPDAQADAALRGTVALALLTLKRDAAAHAHIVGAAPVAQVRLAQAQLLAGEGKAQEALALLRLDDTAAPPPWWTLRAGRRLAQAAGEPEAVAAAGATRARGRAVAPGADGRVRRGAGLGRSRRRGRRDTRPAAQAGTPGRTGPTTWMRCCNTAPGATRPRMRPRSQC